jgi:hypothetical protein
MNVGDPLLMFHRNSGQPVRDSDGMPITVNPAGMTAVVSAVIGDDTVHLTAKDAEGRTFVERYVVVLGADETLPRGGRYALLPGDLPSHHRRPNQFGK